MRSSRSVRPAGPGSSATRGAPHPARRERHDAIVERLFGPLGWDVTACHVPLDPEVPRWGDAPYVDAELCGTMRLADALTHLYVLLPVLDGAKHYWVSADEADKLVRTGGSWLAGHPERDLITIRYLAHQRHLVSDATERLAALDDSPVPEPVAGAAPRPLAGLRREAVLAALRSVEAHRVVDLGCGEGMLLRDLLADPSFTEVLGVDVSARELFRAEKRLDLDRLSDTQRARLTLIQSSVTYRDTRLVSWDAIVLMEVVEHLDPDRLLPGTQRLPRRPPRRRRRDDAQLRLQPALSRTARRRSASPRPPFRVVARAVRRVGRAGLFAATHFGRYEVLSSDVCRGLVSNDENDQSATADAFDAVHPAHRRVVFVGDLEGRKVTPIPEPEWVNNTLCLDTGCVFGGHLTALRYPEKEIVQVPAERVWYEPAKPFPAAGHTERSGAGDPTAKPRAAAVASSAPHTRSAEDLDITDVLGRRVVETAHHGRISVRSERAAGALEVMSRWAMNPRWLGYLPPTMSPVATSTRDGVLEHPDEAFAGYASAGVDRVVCEEKHMGSRAVVLVCRDAELARRRFGADAGETGAIHTRTGRAFFGRDLTEVLLARVRSALDVAGLWDELGTDWLLVDAELLPWSLKAESLIRDQYAPVGAAARLALTAALELLAGAADRGLDVADLLSRTRERADDVGRYCAAYRRYVGDVDGTVWAERDHAWHLERIDRLVEADPVTFRATERLVVDLADDAARTAGVQWWDELTGAARGWSSSRSPGCCARARGSSSRV